jgi:2-polyprenyl-6-methoxyphenol hydroxylase-like FAD-dependent oxidoreductase
MGDILSAPTPIYTVIKALSRESIRGGPVTPHTASGTSKALGDAAGLAHALRGWTPPHLLPAQSLHDWEATRLAYLLIVARTGIRLATQSSLRATFGHRFLSE